MRITTLALVAALCLSCAGNPAPEVITRIPKTVHEACDFYKEARPVVVEYVQWAAANWERIPTEQQAMLLRLKGYLLTLDGLGVDVCAISDALSAIEEGRDVAASVSGGNVDWDAVLSTILKIAGTAAQLKAQGVF